MESGREEVDCQTTSERGQTITLVVQLGRETAGGSDTGDGSGDCDDAGPTPGADSQTGDARGRSEG